PVTRVQIFLSRNKPVTWAGETVVHGEWRPLLGRSHVGEHNAGILMRGIGAVAQPVLQRTVGRLAWGLEDRPIRREQPGVIAAAGALGVDQAELQRRAAVRAMQLQQPDGTALVTEGDEVLA